MPPPSIIETFENGKVSSPPQTVAELLRAGADPNEQGHEVWSPMGAVVFNSLSVEAVQLLIEAGAKIFDQPGMYHPVCAAAEHGADELLQLLFDNRVTPTDAIAWLDEPEKDPRDKTLRVEDAPLHLAAHHGHASTCERIINHNGKDGLNNFDDLSQTPLMCAIQKDHTETARTLLRLGANPDVHDHWKIGSTALDYAVDPERDPACVTTLLEFNANPNIPTWMWRTATERAIENKIEMLPAILNAAHKHPPPEDADGRVRSSWPPV